MRIETDQELSSKWRATARPKIRQIFDAEDFAPENFAQGYAKQSSLNGSDDRVPHPCRSVLWNDRGGD